MKKIAVTILVIITIISSFSFSAYAQDFILGDVNRDGKVTAADARITLRFSAKLEDFSEEDISYADVNSDNKITAKDARTILRVSAKLENFQETSTTETTTANNEIERPGNINYNGHVYTGGPSSKKYHYEADCAGKYSHEITWDEVDSRGLGPCGTCVLK